MTEKTSECWECSRTDGTHRDQCPNNPYIMWLDRRFKPMFTHDCEKCVFYGQAMYNGQNCDFYIHPKGNDFSRSVIARFGDEGCEYSSGPLL